jgi:hypothetical protein
MIEPRKFRPGVSDCAIYAAAVVQDVHGYDPAGAYKALPIFARLQLFRAGPAAALAHMASLYDWRRIDAPVDGAVAILTIGDNASFVVYRNGLWSGQSDGGIVFIPTLKPAEIWDTA